MKSPILGSSYVARSVNAADNRMVNLFPEVIPEGGKEPAFLSRCPGLTLMQTVGSGPIRGMWQVGLYLYVASGNEMYVVDWNYAATKIGDISGSPGIVSMADNGLQLFVACNGPSYIVNTNTNVVTQITDTDFPGAVTVGYLDGFFVFNEPESQKLWVTSLFDGTQISPLDFASAEGAPDRVVGIIVDHKELWVFGESTTEVWYNAGIVGFPFLPVQGAFSEIGCASPYSIAKMDNTVFWLSRDARGQGIVYKAKGYVGERISTHAVEWQIQQYGDLSSAQAYTYQQDGHSFYVLTFPQGTWVYDAATGAWHERAGWDGTAFTRHRGNCQVFYDRTGGLSGDILIGDCQFGRVYKFDLNVYADNFQPQKWLRSWRALPPGANNLKRSAHHSLQLDCEAGGAVDVNPQVALRFSDDGGHTWSNSRSLSLGTAGEYGKRVIWRRLGMTTKLRDRVYEISGTDAAKISILGAELDMSPTNA